MPGGDAVDVDVAQPVVALRGQPERHRSARCAAGVVADPRVRQMLRSRAGSAAPSVSAETWTVSSRAIASAGRPAAMARHTSPS